MIIPIFTEPYQLTMPSVFSLQPSQNRFQLSPRDLHLPALFVGICVTAITLLPSHAAPLDTWSSGLAFGNNQSLGYADGLFLSGTERRIFTRENGNEFWISRFNVNFNSFHGFAFGTGSHLAVGTGNPDNARFSSDGNTWTALPTATWNRLWAVAHGNNRFVAVGQRYAAYTMEDPTAPGAAWVPRDSGLASGSNFQSENLYAIAWSGSRFVAVGNSGRSTRSDDGTTWTSQTISSTVTFRGITFAAGQFIAVGNQSNNSPALFTSPDGIAWTDNSTRIASAFGSNTIRSIAHGDGMWVVVGDNSKLIFSENSIDWTARDTGFTGNYLSVVHGDAQWQVGMLGQILLSGGSSVVPPEITDATGAGRYAASDLVTLGATVTGTPPPMLRWSLNGVDLNDGPGISGATTTTLVLTGIVPTQSGNYKLTATADAGTAETTLAVTVSTTAGGAAFTPLGIAPGHNISNPSRILTDGSITGFTGLTSGGLFPFRYQDATGLVRLPHFGDALDGSSDGSLIILETNGAPAVLSNGIKTDFPAFPDATFTGPTAVNHSGNLIVGGANLPDGSQTAFRWTSAGGFAGFGTIPGDRHPARATSLTPDGLTAVGHLDGPSLSRRGFIWTEATGLHPLPQPGGTAVGDVRRISRDGSFVVGFSNSPSQATRWTRDAAHLLEALSAQVPAHGLSDAWGSSNAGVVVGNSRTQVDVFSGTATFWTAADQPVHLQDWLASQFSLALPGWTLISIFDINAPGTVVTGIGNNPAGLTEAWKLELPSPLTADFGTTPPAALSFALWSSETFTSDPGLGLPGTILNPAGITNLEAFVFGLDPIVPDLSHMPGFQSATSPGGPDGRFTYRLSHRAAGYNLSICTSPSLLPGTWSEFTPPAGSISTRTVEGADEITVEVPFAFEKAFFKIEIQLP